MNKATETCTVLPDVTTHTFGVLEKKEMKDKMRLKMLKIKFDQ